MGLKYMILLHVIHDVYLTNIRCCKEIWVMASTVDDFRYRQSIYHQYHHHHHTLHGCQVVPFNSVHFHPDCHATNTNSIIYSPSNTPSPSPILCTLYNKASLCIINWKCSFLETILGFEVGTKTTKSLWKTNLLIPSHQIAKLPSSLLLAIAMRWSKCAKNEALTHWFSYVWLRL